MPTLTAWLKNLKDRLYKPSSHEKAPVDLSFSRIQTYLRCPWMYNLVYTLGWRAGPNSGMALGMSLHRALASYHSPANSEKTLNRLWEIYDQVWVNEGFSSTQETLDTYDSGRKMLEQFFRSDQERKSEVIGAEKEFNVQMDGNIRFHGTLDRLDRHGDGSFEIVEYKTQGQHWTENRMQTDLQMTLYELGMRKTLGDVPIKLKYTFLSTGQSTTARRTSEQIKAAEKLMNDVAERIRNEEFSPNPEHCPKCEFSNRCSYYQKPGGPK